MPEFERQGCKHPRIEHQPLHVDEELRKSLENRQCSRPRTSPIGDVAGRKIDLALRIPQPCLALDQQGQPDSGGLIEKRPPISCGCASTRANCMPSGESMHHTAPRNRRLPGNPPSAEIAGPSPRAFKAWRCWRCGTDCVAERQAFNRFPTASRAAPNRRRPASASTGSRRLGSIARSVRQRIWLRRRQENCRPLRQSRLAGLRPASAGGSAFAFSSQLPGRRASKAATRWPSPPLCKPLPPVPATSSLHVNSIGIEASSTSTGTAEIPGRIAGGR